MKKQLFILVSLLALSVFADKYTFDIRLNNLDGVYEKDEKIVFTSNFYDEGKPAKDITIEVLLYHDAALVKKSVVPAKNPIIVETSMANPGYCKIQLIAKDKNNKFLQQMSRGRMRSVVGNSGAIVAPLEIKPGAPEPKDFDAFWNAEKQKLAKIPMNIESKLSPDSQPHKKVYLVKIDVGSGFRPVQGILHIPANSKPKSLPIHLFVHGAGVHQPKKNKAWAPPIPKVCGIKGPVIFMNLNAHGLANDKEKEFYEEKNKGELKNYPFINNGDTEKYYMKGMILRLIQALNYLKSIPEWNGKDLVVTGGSQGGAQALMAGGMDSQVSCISADVPAMCDHGASLSGLQAGWPKLYSVKPDGKIMLARSYSRKNDVTWNKSIINNAGYFDTANFAKRIKGTVHITTGGWDSVCSPTSVFAAYNSIPSQGKKIEFYPQGGHCRGVYKNTEQQKAAIYIDSQKVK